jgi:hypothetical protein
MGDDCSEQYIDIVWQLLIRLIYIKENKHALKTIYIVYDQLITIPQIFATSELCLQVIMAIIFTV